MTNSLEQVACVSVLISGSDLTTVLELVLQAKNTGQLSLITSGMSAAGAVARIFTSIQEGAGLSMVRGFCIGESPVSCLVQPFLGSACVQPTIYEVANIVRDLAGGILNLIITLQILWYDKNTRAQAKRSAKKKE